MDQRVYIAQLNIEHFRRRLLTEKDAAIRQQLALLLAEEEVRLGALCDAPEKDKEKHKS